MSTDRPAGGAGRGGGLRHWLPALVAALGADPAGGGDLMWASIAGRRARIALDDDVVLVESASRGHLAVRADDPAADPDGTGATGAATVLGLLAGDRTLGGAILAGEIEIRSPVGDALWMYRAIELLLDGASRCPGLRALADEFSALHDGARRPPPPGWREGAADAESAMLGRLGLLTEATVDRDA